METFKTTVSLKNLLLLGLIVVAFGAKGQSEENGKPDIKLLLGPWTDHSTHNASIAFYKDSLFYVDALTFIHYDLKSDTLIRYFDGITDISAITKLTIDSLVISSSTKTEKYVRFKE